MPRPFALDQIEAIPHRPEADSFDFRQSWQTIKHACAGHKLLIAATCLLTVSLVVLYTRLWPPIFSAEVMLVAEADRDASREGFYQGWSVFRKDNTMDELELFTAKPVLEAVAVKLGLGYDDVYHPFVSYAGHLWKESWPGRTYQKAKEWIFPPKKGKYDATPEQAELARVIYDFKSGVKLAPIAETNVGKLVVKGPSPRVAEVANTMTEVYFQERRDRHVREADNSIKALKAELGITQKELADLENKMLKYYTANDLILTFEKDKGEISQAVAIRAAIVDLQASVAGQESALEEVNASLAKEEKQITNSRMIAVNPIIDSLRDKLSQLELQRKQTLIHFRSDSPEIKEIDRQVAIAKEQLGATPANTVRQTTIGLNSIYETLRARKAQLEADIAGQRAALASKQEAAAKYKALEDSIPEKMKVVHDFDREHTALDKKFVALNDKLMTAVVSRATALSAAPPIQVVAAATPPAEPDWPMSKTLLLGGAGLGAVMGVLLAMLMDLLYSRVRRDHLLGAEPGLVYALVGQDQAFAARLFSPPEPRTNGREGNYANTGPRMTGLRD